MVFHRGLSSATGTRLKLVQWTEDSPPIVRNPSVPDPLIHCAPRPPEAQMRGASPRRLRTSGELPRLNCQRCAGTHITWEEL